MNVNQSRVLASDLFLIQNWNLRTEPPTQRRNAIFHDFVKLGMRGRWTWHSKAEICEFSHFTTEERRILERRDWPTRCIAGLIGEDLRRVVVVDHAQSLSDADVEFRTDLAGDNSLVCRHDGNPFEVLPELVYSMTAFDDPDDVEEARQSRRDDSLWVSGVFWVGNMIIWVDEFGATVRQKVCDLQDRQAMRAAADSVEKFRPFESSWWTEATRSGKYAEDHWWEL
jgi:hypothetical protein